MWCDGLRSLCPSIETAKRLLVRRCDFITTDGLVDGAADVLDNESSMQRKREHSLRNGWSPLVILLWTPRVLAMAFILLMSMYTVDVFADGREFWATGAAFVQRLVPAFSALFVLLLGWRRDGLAALGFLALSVAYVVALGGWGALPDSAVLVVPPAGISLAFFARMKLLQRGVRTGVDPRRSGESL